MRLSACIGCESAGGGLERDYIYLEALRMIVKAVRVFVEARVLVEAVTVLKGREKCL